MDRPITVLSMGMSADGKNSAGAAGELDADREFPESSGVEEGPRQHQEIEQMRERSGAVSLRPMTAEMYHVYYREYRNDPDLYMDKSEYAPFVYSPEWVERYIQRQISKNRKCFAIMVGDEMAGEIILKNIEPGRCATLGICMKNDRYKNRGIGTRAEELVIDYVFQEMDIPVLWADTLVTNTRSRHVLEKLGFQLLRGEGDFLYYRITRGEMNRE